MASQPIHVRPTPVPATDWLASYHRNKPSVSVAFIAGEAAQAVDAVMASLPEATRESTLEEIAAEAADWGYAKQVASLTNELVATAKELLSPNIHTAFLLWGEKASYFATSGYSDEEAGEVCDASCDAVRALSKEPPNTIHDVALKAYVFALEAADSSCFGPLKEPTAQGWQGLAIEVALGVGADMIWLTPLAAMLEDLSARAWAAAPKKSGFLPEVGNAITTVFAAARADDSVCRKAAQQVDPAVGVPTGYDRFMRGPLIAWQRQYARYEAANAELDKFHDEVRVPMLTADHTPEDILESMRAHADELRNAVHQETERLFRLPAPSASELATKLQIFADLDGCELTYADDSIKQFTIDARRFGRHGAHLRTDFPLLDAWAVYRQGLQDIVDDPIDVNDDVAYARMDPATMALLEGRATTLEGVLIKLRHGFHGTIHNLWGNDAVLNPTSDRFRAGLDMEDISVRTIWGAIEDLARIGGVNLMEQGQ